MNIDDIDIVATLVLAVVFGVVVLGFVLAMLTEARAARRVKARYFGNARK